MLVNCYQYEITYYDWNNVRCLEDNVMGNFTSCSYLSISLFQYQFHQPYIFIILFLYFLAWRSNGVLIPFTNS